MARKPCLILGLISHDRVAKLQDGPWIRCNDAAISCQMWSRRWATATGEACLERSNVPGVHVWHQGDRQRRWCNLGRSARPTIRSRCQHVRAHDEPGGYGGGVRTARHHRHARLSSAFVNALRGRAIAWAINIAEAQRRTVAAVAVAEQLFSAARAAVAAGFAILCRCSDGIGVNGNGGYQWSCADSAGGMAVPSSGFGYCWSL